MIGVLTDANNRRLELLAEMAGLTPEEMLNRLVCRTWQKETTRIRQYFMYARDEPKTKEAAP